MLESGVNQTLIQLILKEPLSRYNVLDLGCGEGALTFIVAEKAKEVVGIDVSENAIERAREIKSLKGFSNVEFHVQDAYDEEVYESYSGRIDMVVSHLFMSDEVIRNSYNLLPTGGCFAFACLHSKHLMEGGRRSRFSYSQEEMGQVLGETGFKIEYLGVESRKISFGNEGEALNVLGGKRVERWKRDGRLKSLQTYIQSEGRHLTVSTLIGKTRKSR